MKDILKVSISLAAGAGIGILATYKYFEKKYKKLADEEIESVKEAFKKEESENDIPEKKPEVKIEETKSVIHEKSSFEDAKIIIEKHNYSTPTELKNVFDQINGNDIIDDDEVNYDPYIIPPDEFGNEDDYDRVSLVYYADYILADENDDIVENIEDTVGPEALTSFGEYEDDSVFVRNDRFKTYYEILLDNRTWSEVTGR